MTTLYSIHLPTSNIIFNLFATELHACAELVVYTPYQLLCVKSWIPFYKIYDRITKFHQQLIHKQICTTFQKFNLVKQ
jgi:hypothetical protein